MLVLIVNCFYHIGAYRPIYKTENNNIDLFVYPDQPDSYNIIPNGNENGNGPVVVDEDDESNNQQILALEEAQELRLASFRNARRQLQGKEDDVDSGREEIYILEEKDYPKSLYERYKGIGQVSGITTLPSGDVVVFHRGQSGHEWTQNTFNTNYTLNLTHGSVPSDNLIKSDTIAILKGDDGSPMESLGSNLFYMPHSIASDNEGNLWVSDVARHQVMRLPAGMVQHTNTSRIWPDIILGEAFVPGRDLAHFCQPSEIVVSSDGRLIFVADGYCNQRVMVFLGGSGKFLTSFGQDLNMNVVHSMTLIEERNLICVADRENARILCFKAGLDGNLIEIGQLVLSVNYPLGRVFAIEALSSNHLLVSSNQIGTNKYDVALLNPFSRDLKQVWTSTDLLEPHSLAKTRDGLYVYAADLSKGAYKKVFKFHVIKRTR